MKKLLVLVSLLFGVAGFVSTVSFADDAKKAAKKGAKAGKNAKKAAAAKKDEAAKKAEAAKTPPKPTEAPEGEMEDMEGEGDM